ncbi:hypothetical protein [Streptacidiphilus sp. EB103A]|uniref:hypothetical protein n=1 Tax=Streptacidiphilus sp. EB103A TaxID=3156275 RepID=UPI003514C785
MTATTGPDLDAGELTELLLRLLTDDDYRKRLAEHGAQAVARNAAEFICLSTVDQQELDFTARRFRSNLWKGDGANGIAAAFPRSVALLERVGWHQQRLLSAFLRSPEFEAYRALPYTGEGTSLEEAFGTFAMSLPEEEVGRGDTGSEVLRCTLEHEMLMALFTALVHESPVAFRSGVAGIMSTDNGYAVLRTYSAAVLAGWGVATAGAGPLCCLYTSTPRGMVFGPVPQRVADALSRPGEASAEKVRQALRMRGIW